MEQQSLFDEAASLELPEVFSIGHSTRSLEELIAVLNHYRIEALVDIRHFPLSRHNPQFNEPLLRSELPARGIEYRWLPSLGGFRKAGYLAYTASEEFAKGIEELESLARRKRTAFLCAELKWFQCHRRYVSDVLTGRGWHVTHIFDEQRAVEHFPKTNPIKCD